MYLQPTSNYVLLENPKQDEEISEGGIVVPQGAELKEYELSTILAVGPEVNRLNNGDMGPEIIKEGAEAIYAKGDYVIIESDGNPYRIVSASRICAVINMGGHAYFGTDYALESSDQTLKTLVEVKE